jgi:hypothetical protein
MKSNFLNLTNMKTIKLLFLPLFALALLSSCSDDDDAPAPVNPSELITNVEVIFTNETDPNDVVTLSAVSADGIVDPTLTVSGPFTANADYTATITILDNVNNENILEEVVEEKDEHFFAYAVNQTIDVIDMIRDDSIDPQRTDGNYLGVDTAWTFGAASTGTFTLQLVHEASSVDDQFGEAFEFGLYTGGELDINNTWNIEIQ